MRCGYPRVSDRDRGHVRGGTAEARQEGDQIVGDVRAAVTAGAQGRAEGRNRLDEPADAGGRVPIPPVCIGVGGRAGIGRAALVDALAQRMAGRGPLAIGVLPACNDPRNREGPERRAEAGRPDGSTVPVDIAVHLVLHAPAPSDRRAMDAQRGRGVPVLMVRTRGGEGYADARRTQTPGPAAAGSADDAGSAVLRVGLRPEGPPTGLDELVDCLSAGAGRILAARADAHRGVQTRAALEGPDREAAERWLRSGDARRVRAAGARNWGAAITTPGSALREAARWRSVAARASGEAQRERATAWVRRCTDRAVELGASVRGPGDA